MTRVLLVEDERAIAESLEFALRRDGFEVHRAATLQQAQREVSACDLVVLDLMLPDGSGFDLLNQLRREGSRVPVLILSSRDEEADRVAGLEGGADDYIVKPFSPREVVARVRAVLRRVQPAQPLQPLQPLGDPPSHPHRRPADGPGREETTPPPTPGSALFRHGELMVDPDTRRCIYGATVVDLTRTEFDLLLVLGSAPDRVFTRQQLIDRIFGQGYAVSDRTIDAHVKALRKKLGAAGADPDLIETERGVGYRLRQA